MDSEARISSTVWMTEKYSSMDRPRLKSATTAKFLSDP
jgi:hypothetical protein